MYRPPQNTNIVKSIRSKFESIENSNSSQKSNGKNGYRNNLNLSDSPKIKKQTSVNVQTGNQILQRQISDQGKRNIKRTPAFRVDRSLERANGFQRHCYNRSTLFECKVKQFTAVRSNCDSNCNFVNNGTSDKQPLLGTEETKNVNHFSSNKKPVLIKSKSSHDFQYIRNKFDGNSVSDTCEGTRKDINCIDFVNTENINNRDLSLLYTEPVPKALRNKNVNELEVLNVVPESQVNNIHCISTIEHCDKLPTNTITEGLTDTLKTALKRPLPIGPAPRKPPRTFKALNTDDDISNTLEKNLSFLHVSKQPDEKLHNNPKTTVKRADPKYMLNKLENALRNNKLRARKQARLDISTTSGEDSDDSLLFRSKSNRTLPRLPSQESDDNNAPAFNFNCLNGLRFAMTNYEKIKEPNSCFFVGSPQKEPVYAEPFHYRKDSLDSAIRKREGSTRSKQSARNSLYYMSSPLLTEEGKLIVTMDVSPYQKMDLQALNASSVVERKPISKLPDLPVDTPQRISSAKVVRGKFGEVVLLDLGEKVTFLPQRVTEGYRPYIEEFASGKYAVIFKGLKDTGKPNPAASFEIIEN